MEWMTTKDAADKLGVSDIRIRQFIDEGRLVAQKFGPMWMVSLESVKGFERQPTGRPPQADKPKPVRKRKRRRA